MSDVDQPIDHESADDGVARGQTNNFEKHIKSKRTWLRLLFMIVMSVAWSISVMVTSVIVIVNFFYVLLTGDTNPKLTGVGHSFAMYLYQIAEYLTFNSDERPFPFDGDWPHADNDA